MKAVIWLVFLSIPFIAWLPARFWNICGDPWCLIVFPEWLDKMLTSVSLPYLEKDISEAARQIDFLEVWISSVIILEMVALLVFILFRSSLNEDD